MNTTKRAVPLVSVIITTRNEEHALKLCLASIRGQTYRTLEIIVVDNASGDRTREIAQRFTSHVFDKGPERSAQRNFGARIARGNYLLFLDADMTLMPSVIEECVRRAQKGNVTHQAVRALIIPEKTVGVGFWAACKILERSFYERVDWMEAARFYDKETFTFLHGFDETLTGPEDFDLSQRVLSEFGAAGISQIRTHIYHNEGRVRLWSLLRKKYYYGKEMRMYMKKKENFNALQKQANPIVRFAVFLRRPRALLSDPVHAIGMISMKTLELGALALGAIVGNV